MTDMEKRLERTLRKIEQLEDRHAFLMTILSNKQIKLYEAYLMEEERKAHFQEMLNQSVVSYDDLEEAFEYYLDYKGIRLSEAEKKKRFRNFLISRNVEIKEKDGLKR